MFRNQQLLHVIKRGNDNSSEETEDKNINIILKPTFRKKRNSRFMLSNQSPRSSLPLTMQQSISNPREKNDSIDLQQETVYENFPVLENLTLKEKEAKPVIIEITEKD